MHLVAPIHSGSAQTDAFKELVERLPLPAIIRRGPKVVIANNAFSRTLSREADNLVGGSILNMVHADERERMHQYLVGGSKPGESRSIGPLKWLRRNGLTASLEIEVAQEIVLEGSPAVLWVLRDVSQQRSIDTRTQISDRMASVGTMAAGVAHEINNPLSFIINNITFVQRELKGVVKNAEKLGIDIEEWNQALQEALEGATRVRDIVRDMKTFSRATDSDVTACNIDEILNGAIKLGRNEIRHRAQLNKHCHDVPLVKGNPGRLGQVFLNMLLNAAQAIPDGEADKNTIDVLVEATPDGKVVVEVFDTGIGMSAEQLSRIFDPFYTTKPVGVGTGLGLSICHGIISDLGGTIDVQSSPGQGSVFRVTLPRAEKIAESQAALSVMPRAVKTADGLKVLVVDDDEFVARGIRRQLGSSHQVQHAVGATTALQWFQEGHHDFDLILCDLMMPDVSGEVFYREVQRLWPELAKKFVFITGGAFSEGAQAFLNTTTCTWLEKPIDSSRLEAVVEKARLR
jgi:PAS domain S-box-containing protein